MAGLPTIEPTAPEHAPEIRQFLATVFGYTPDAYFLTPDVFSWKAFAARPDWPESRSYVIRHRGRLASHGCVWPMNLHTPNGPVTALQIIDWAANPDALPGAGALLRRQIIRRVQVSFGVGGSPDARRVMPRDGYVNRADYQSMALVLRPWAQFRRRWAQPDPKRWLRLARNAAWSWQSRITRREPAGWQVEPVARFEAETSPPPPPPFLASSRPAALLNYYLDFPGFPLRAARLLHGGRPAGHMVWCSLNGQTRIVDFQVEGAEPGIWQAAAAAATAALTRLEPDACELAVFLTLPLAIEAFTHAGYRVRRTEPVFLRDPDKWLPTDLPLHITAVDFDGFYLHSPDNPFLT